MGSETSSEEERDEEDEDTDAENLEKRRSAPVHRLTRQRSLPYIKPTYEDNVNEHYRQNTRKEVQMKVVPRSIPSYRNTETSTATNGSPTIFDDYNGDTFSLTSHTANHVDFQSKYRRPVCYSPVNVAPRGQPVNVDRTTVPHTIVNPADLEYRSLIQPQDHHHQYYYHPANHGAYVYHGNPHLNHIPPGPGNNGHGTTYPVTFIPADFIRSNTMHHSRPHANAYHSYGGPDYRNAISDIGYAPKYSYHMAQYPHMGVPVAPAHQSPGRTKVLRSDLEQAREGRWSPYKHWQLH